MHDWLALAALWRPGPTDICADKGYDSSTFVGPTLVLNSKGALLFQGEDHWAVAEMLTRGGRGIVVPIFEFMCHMPRLLTIVASLDGALPKQSIDLIIQRHVTEAYVHLEKPGITVPHKTGYSAGYFDDMADLEVIDGTQAAFRLVARGITTLPPSSGIDAQNALESLVINGVNLMRLAAKPFPKHMSHNISVVTNIVEAVYADVMLLHGASALTRESLDIGEYYCTAPTDDLDTLPGVMESIVTASNEETDDE